MTLFKQIALLVTLMFLLLASIIVANDFNRTGEFLQGQLQTTAQDMTTTLGIAISNLPSGDDQATLEVLFNSVFDSGYYSSVRLVSPDGLVIHQKSQVIDIEGIPNWFLQLVNLKPAQGSTVVMKGWTQLGELTLSLHPGYAYSGLYSALKLTLKWFAVLFALAIIVLWLMLHYLLIPLQRVKEQADSIHRNQFVQQEKIPVTVELKSVVIAMNRMVSRVQSIFDDQAETLSQYQQLLYRDKLTGLGNRRYMMDHLKQALSEESSFHGTLSVIKLVNFDQMREKSGYELSDELITRLASIVSEANSSITADKVARLSEDEFAFLVAADEESTLEFIHSIFDKLRNNNYFAHVQETLFPVAGVTTLEPGQGLGDLLSGIDYCLSQATSLGSYSIKQKELVNLDLPKGKMQWRVWLENVLDADRLFLVAQPVIDRNQAVVHKELFIRTRDEHDQVIPASAFMPMAAGLGMALEIDKAVFKLVRDNTDIDQDVPVAINLSAAFFELADAQEEFDQLLIDCQKRGIRLCIEANHHVLHQHPEMCNQVADRVKKNGHQFGMDKLDMGLPLQLVQSARFDYVKINANTLGEMLVDDLASGFQALKALTDTLDIDIIAVAVDSQKMFDQLQDKGINVMQGNYLGEPG